MTIELKWGKKINDDAVTKFNNFFLAHFNLYQSIQNFCNTIRFRAFGERHANCQICEAEKSNSHSCNLPLATGILIPVSSSSQIKKVKVKKLILRAKEKPVFTSKRCEKVFRFLTTFSLSFLNKKYLHNWKTIFAHLLKKTNLLVRSDNNTGFSLSKVLQTTTI